MAKYKTDSKLETPEGAIIEILYISPTRTNLNIEAIEDEYYYFIKQNYTEGFDYDCVCESYLNCCKEV